MKRQIVQINQKFINSSYFVHKYLILYNQFERTHTEDVVMTPLHIKFFHNNRPGKPLPGHSSFISPYFGGFFYFTGYNIIDIRVQKNVLKEMHCENMWHAIIQIINKE